MNKTRRESIAMLEACSSCDQIINLMSPDDSKYWGWNFVAMKKYNTIEFRRGPPSTTVNEVFQWVELAMSFIQASIYHGAPANLERIPATIGSLRWFIQSANLTNVAGMNDFKHIEELM